MSQNLRSFTAKNLAGQELSMSQYVGKPTLIENVASLWGTTVADMTAMNGLVEKFGDRANVVAFPCNQVY